MPPPVAVPIELTREQDFLLERTESEILITGTRFVLPPFDPSSWAQRDLTVRAWEVTLGEDLTLPGRTVTIACHTLRLARPVTLSVNGRAGRPHPVAANNGREPGAHGAAGLAGADGTDGGTICLLINRLEGETLSLTADGGYGAPGQPGGDGQKGRGGGNGGDANRSRRGHNSGGRGGDGGRGGNAGKGGDGGRGGDGGAITVLATVPIPDGRLTTSAQPGAAGPPGAAGRPGAGGDPGRGGRNRDCEHEPGEGGGFADRF